MKYEVEGELKSREIREIKLGVNLILKVRLINVDCMF